MRNVIFTAILTFVFAFYPAVVSAQGAVQNGRNQTSTVSPATAANQIQNQNQIQVQNQGEETQIRTATQQMQQLMQMEGLGEEVGNKVMTIAKEQVQAQNQIQAELNKLESRSVFMKKLFGPDLNAIKNLKGQIQQNQLRIQNLQQLQNQVLNEADETQLQESIQALVNQNTSLQEQVSAEEQVGSIFGWLFRLFN